jgi:hypothetical protein
VFLPLLIQCALLHLQLRALQVPLTRTQHQSLRKASSQDPDLACLRDHHHRKLSSRIGLPFCFGCGRSSSRICRSATDEQSCINPTIRTILGHYRTHNCSNHLEPQRKIHHLSSTHGFVPLLAFASDGTLVPFA